MSTEKRRSGAHAKPRRGGNHNDIGLRDVGQFVETYHHLLDKLYPVFAVWDVLLYVTRWENYLLTLATMLILSLLLYFPSVLCSLLTLAAILVMGIGRYHGQTKTLMELRKTPTVELLDQDEHLLKKQYSEQEHMHKSRIEFRQILSNAENFMLRVEKVLNYIYSIYLWKSPEVSLCVTVLLCLVLVLICTIDLHTIGAAIPPIVLCTNGHFFSRSIDLWKLFLRRLKHRFDRRWGNRQRTETQVTASNHEEVEREEEEPEREEVVEPEHSSAVKPSLPVPEEQQESSNETGLSDASHTTELRQRSNLGCSTDSTPAPAAGGGGVDISVSRSGEGVLDSDTAGQPQPIKKDGKATQHELCSKCKTALSFLKRKHDCNMCGQTFCGSCTLKVKKAALGVTSPAAYEMSVRVCLNCKAQLDQGH